MKEIPLTYLAASPHRVAHVWEERSVLHLLTSVNFSKSPKLFGTSKNQQSLFFVMELIVGAPLHLHLPISLEDARNCFVQILDIVEFLHNHKIIHKDIKLSNFIVSDDTSGPIRICDFGLSVILPNEKLYGCICGTFHTKAPESTISFAQDFYSLGILLYELLTPLSVVDSPSLDLTSIEHLPDAVDLITQLTEESSSSRLQEFSKIRKHAFLKDIPKTPMKVRNSDLAYQFIFGRPKTVLDDF